MINFALIGCGKIAERHARLLSGGHVKDARLLAACDTNAERLTAFCSRYGVKGYGSIEALMQDSSIGAVTVLTPSGLHARHVLELSRFGRPIVVEKPMALTLDDADKMIEACDAARVKLFVVKQNRLNRPVQATRRHLERNRFGKLIMGTVRVRWCRKQDYYAQDKWRGTWAYDGGVLANQASHHIDLLEWMLGPVESVFGVASTALARIEAEDTAVVSLRFKNGALGVIEATTATRPKDLEGSLSILGEKGAVEIGGFAVDRLKTWQFETEVEEDRTIFETAGSNPAHPVGYAHAAYYESIMDSILNNTPQLVDGLAGRKSLELITAIYESIESARQVELRFAPKRCRLGIFGT
jgi:UDP-N-acetyl-2-amino-2-deoxyglucuronate dehydrogenase